MRVENNLISRVTSPSYIPRVEKPESIFSTLLLNNIAKGSFMVFQPSYFVDLSRQAKQDTKSMKENYLSINENVLFYTKELEFIFKR